MYSEKYRINIILHIQLKQLFVAQYDCKPMTGGVAVQTQIIFH